MADRVITWNIPGPIDKQGPVVDYNGHAFYADADYRVGRVTTRQKTNVAVPNTNPVIFDINIDGTSIYADQSARPHLFDSEIFDQEVDHGFALTGDWVTLDIDQVAPGFEDISISVTLVKLAESEN